MTDMIPPPPDASRGRYTLARLVVGLLVLAAFVATGLGARIPAFALAAGAWIIGARLLTPSSRPRIGFFDKSLVTVAIVLAAVQILQFFVGPGSLAKWVGQPAPPFTVTTLDGQQFNLADQRGKRVFIDFWATWCPPCRATIPNIIELQKEHQGKDLVIIGISNESPDTLRAYVKEYGINYPVAAATTLPAPYADVSTIPTMFIIDKDGTIETISQGYKSLETLQHYAEPAKTASSGELPEPAT